MDYGNVLVSADLRKLPDDLQKIKQLALPCSLETENGNFSSELIERFANLSRDDLFEMKYVSKSFGSVGIFFIVQLFVNGVLFEDKPTEPTESDGKLIKAACISETMSPCSKTKDAQDIEKQTVDIERKDAQKQQNNLEHQPKSASQTITDKILTKYAISAIAKFIEPSPLTDDDLCVIRFIESPRLFCLQQVINIDDFNLMAGKLLKYCETAPPLEKFEVGVACAARYKNDPDWYRSEILDVTGTRALIRFVDYGVILTTKINELKEISNDFLVMPKQAVHCCLLGFDLLYEAKSSTEQMELLAEGLNGERRKFSVKIHGLLVNNTVLVNLLDDTEVPTFDLSLRILQLSLSKIEFRQHKVKVLKKDDTEDTMVAVQKNVAPIHTVIESDVQVDSNRKNMTDTPDHDTYQKAVSNTLYTIEEVSENSCTDSSSSSLPRIAETHADDSESYKMGHSSLTDDNR